MLPTRLNSHQLNSPNSTHPTQLTQFNSHQPNSHQFKSPKATHTSSAHPTRRTSARKVGNKIEKMACYITRRTNELGIGCAKFGVDSFVRNPCITVYINLRRHQTSSLASPSSFSYLKTPASHTYILSHHAIQSISPLNLSL